MLFFYLSITNSRSTHIGFWGVFVYVGIPRGIIFIMGLVWGGDEELLCYKQVMLELYD